MAQVTCRSGAIVVQARRIALICRQFHGPPAAVSGLHRSIERPPESGRRPNTLGFYGRKQGVGFAFVRMRGYGRRRWLFCISRIKYW